MLADLVVLAVVIFLTRAKDIDTEAELEVLANER